MDSEFIAPVIVYSIGLVFLFILLRKAILNWVRPSKSKAEKGLWESKTNPLFHLSGVVFIISVIVPVIGGLLIFTGNDWGGPLVFFGFLWLAILSKILND